MTATGIHRIFRARRWALLVGLSATLLGLTACSERSAPPPQPTMTEAERLIDEGRRKARTCIGCHGPSGISRVASYPSIAGMDQAAMRTQLKAFRSGERHDPMMSSIARNLADDDILALSAYYSSLPSPGEQP